MAAVNASRPLHGNSSIFASPCNLIEPDAGPISAAIVKVN
jgi:hypothetical protein